MVGVAATAPAACTPRASRSNLIPWPATLPNGKGTQLLAPLLVKCPTQSSCASHITGARDRASSRATGESSGSWKCQRSTGRARDNTIALQWSTAEPPRPARRGWHEGHQAHAQVDRDPPRRSEVRIVTTSGSQVPTFPCKMDIICGLRCRNTSNPRPSVVGSHRGPAHAPPFTDALEVVTIPAYEGGPAPLPRL